ncbi:YfbU family protein [Pseudomonas putida]|uniref:YfbU family protein n=1 Tax=Pseudomonas putida TaxID=303 RepID=A0A7Y7ZC76_PSEPU|nr:YfbU family protein [Pseudomonas putida]NWC82195.1 YfbU family protein [Pseudomonas putida]
MKLTNGERLITLMLCELYDKLDVVGEVDPDFLRTAIYTENEWSLAWKYPGIPFEPGEEPPELREVLDILEMWSFIESSYSELSEPDKASLLTKTHPFSTAPKFPGFDGNNESEYISISSILIDQLDRFQDFSGRDLNAHMPTLSTYRRMLAKFREVREGNWNLLDVDDLESILAERVHPENRL